MVVEDEEDKDETVEHPVYNGYGRKAVNAYRKFLSDTVIQKQCQTSLTEMFARIEREDIY